MDQQKIGAFLRTLRREKGITQEELAESMNVSRRTVSRWETGANLPDLALLVELADFHDVDLRELFNGERKDADMDETLKDTMRAAADYAETAKEKMMRRTQWLFIAAAVAGAVYMGLLFFGPEEPGPVGDFFSGVCLGIMFAMLLVGILVTGRNAGKIAQWKMKTFGRKRDS